MRFEDRDPHGLRLPIKIDATSNGEFAPVPLGPTNRLGNRIAHEHATEHARRSGLERRAFLKSTCGAASTLLAFNVAHAATGFSGGFSMCRRMPPSIVSLPMQRSAAMSSSSTFRVIT